MKPLSPTLGALPSYTRFEIKGNFVIIPVITCVLLCIMSLQDVFNIVLITCAFRATWIRKNKYFKIYLYFEVIFKRHKCHLHLLHFKHCYSIPATQYMYMANKHIRIHWNPRTGSNRLSQPLTHNLLIDGKSQNLRIIL